MGTGSGMAVVGRSPNAGYGQIFYSKSKDAKNRPELARLFDLELGLENGSIVPYDEVYVFARLADQSSRVGKLPYKVLDLIRDGTNKKIASLDYMRGVHDADKYSESVRIGLKNLIKEPCA